MKLEVFYDYTCPFCYTGYERLKEVLVDYPELEVVWRPCEAHPRPETYGLHSDLCARGFYQAEKQGADLDQYHKIMYKAGMADKDNIEDLEVVADLIANMTDRKTFYKALTEGKYQSKLDENNRQAWAVENFSAVPSLRLDGSTLVAVPGIGITKDQIKQFLGAAE